MSLVSFTNPLPAKLFMARLLEAEAAGRVNRAGIGPRCFVSAVALVVGIGAFLLPPPGAAIGLAIGSVGLGGVIALCPGQ